jgi:hypothetical protein
VNKKVLSLGVVLVALVGSLLAAFIPSASAQRVPHAASCTYSEYTECGYSTITAGPDIKVGTALAKGVIVTGNNFGDLTLSDNGQTVVVPAGATLTIATDGTLIVSTTHGNFGKGSITVIGGEVNSIYLHPATGITFGPNHLLSKVLGYVKYYSGGTRERLTSSKLYNRPHGQLLVKLKTPTAKPVIAISGNILEYTKAEAKYLKAHKAKRVEVLMTVRTTTGTAYRFQMAVPITKLYPTVFPKTAVKK